MVKKWPCFRCFFLGDVGQENVFYDILERNNAFLGYKNKKFKKSTNCIFLKGLTHGFGPKMAIFATFFKGNIDQENVFYDILERKNVFVGYKNKKIKKSENWHFNIDQENIFYDILERKNAFLGYKNKKFKKLKTWHFSKVVNPWFWPKNGDFSNFSF